MDTWRKRFDLALAALFALLVLAPGLGLLAGFPGFASLAEKREPAPIPGPPKDLKQAAELPRAFEKAFDDRFGLRNDGIFLNNVLDYYLLGRSPVDSVVLGRDGWLYLRTSLDYRRQPPFTAAQVDQAQAYVAGMQRWLAGRGIAYFLTVAPNKASVHPEHLPASAPAPGGPSRYDQLKTRLAKAGLPLIDLQGPLREAAKTQPVYSRTDTHWNGDGRFVGYRTLIAALNASGFGSPTLPLEAFQRTVEPRGGFDLAMMIGLDNLLPDTLILYQPARPHAQFQTRPDLLARHWPPRALPLSFICPGKAGRLLLVGDSFIMDEALPRLLAEHFGEVLVLSRLALPIGLNTLIPVLEEFRPDLVVEETVERVLTNPLALAPDFPRQAELDRLYRELPGRPLDLSGADPAGLVLRPGAATRLALPALGPGRPAVLRADVSAPARATLNLTSGGKTVGAVTLRPGVNAVYLALPEAAASLELSLAGAGGDCTLRGLAIHDPSGHTGPAQPWLPLLLK